MEHNQSGIVETLLGVTLLGSEWVLWLLLVLSVISIALIAERTIFFIGLKTDFAELTSKLRDSFVSNSFTDLKAYIQNQKNPESKVLEAGLQYEHVGPQAMEESMEAYLAGEKPRCEKFLTFLGTMGSNAPFIGLFGTVIGIIQAFDALNSNIAGSTGASAGAAPEVMAGIAEALVATAVGLFVAIPAVISFNTFNRVIKRHFANAESVKKLLLSHVVKK